MKQPAGPPELPRTELHASATRRPRWLLRVAVLGVALAAVVCGVLLALEYFHEPGGTLEVSCDDPDVAVSLSGQLDNGYQVNKPITADTGRLSLPVGSYVLVARKSADRIYSQQFRIEDGDHRSFAVPAAGKLRIEFDHPDAVEVWIHEEDGSRSEWNTKRPVEQWFAVQKLRVGLVGRESKILARTEVLLRKNETRVVKLPPGTEQPIAKKKPASKEVLEELGHAVAFQQENVRVVRAHLEEGKASKLDLCVAEILLTEARIKLAAAEQKPVIGLLENLVRLREEDLMFAEVRVEAGLVLETEILAAKQRLAEARTRLATARAEQQ